MQYSKSCVPRLLFFSGQQHFNFYKQQHNKQQTLDTMYMFHGLVWCGVFHIHTIFVYMSVWAKIRLKPYTHKHTHTFRSISRLFWLERVCVFFLGLIWSCYNVCSAFRIRGFGWWYCAVAVAIAAAVVEHTHFLLDNLCARHVLMMQLWRNRAKKRE